MKSSLFLLKGLETIWFEKVIVCDTAKDITAESTEHMTNLQKRILKSHIHESHCCAHEVEAMFSIFPSSVLLNIYIFAVIS